MDNLSTLLAQNFIGELEAIKRDEKEIKRALGTGARHYEVTYTAYCRSLWANEGEPSSEASAETLKAAIDAAAAAFMKTNRRSDWQVGWRATCTIARKDKGWRKVFPVTPSIHTQRLIPGGGIDHPHLPGVMLMRSSS